MNRLIVFVPVRARAFFASSWVCSVTLAETLTFFFSTYPFCRCDQVRGSKKR